MAFLFLEISNNGKAVEPECDCRFVISLQDREL